MEALGSTDIEWYFCAQGVSTHCWLRGTCPAMKKTSSPVFFA